MGRRIYQRKDYISLPVNKSSNGFTLIELLIVVAIIAILAAIAIPNFLAAQVRAKVSRSKAEMRTLATALESYVVDNTLYPPGFFPRPGISIGWNTPDLLPWYLPRLTKLTTPVAFISSIPFDPFNPGDDRNGGDWSDNNNGSYIYYTTYPDDISRAATSFMDPSLLSENQSAKWRLASYGPSRVRFFSIANYTGEGKIGIVDNEYDPTNGTISNGFITRIGP